jgi:hypothetical protein
MGDLPMRRSAAGAAQSILTCRPEAASIAATAAEWLHSFQWAAVEPTVCGFFASVKA